MSSIMQSKSTGVRIIMRLLSCESENILWRGIQMTMLSVHEK